MSGVLERIVDVRSIRNSGWPLPTALAMFSDKRSQMERVSSSDAASSTLRQMAEIFSSRSWAARLTLPKLNLGWDMTPAPF